jgi:hypothetical protein
VNGDDSLFKSPSQLFYDDWLTSIGLAGFIPSIGKNYSSQDFHIVNSRYTWKGQVIPYINMGIIYGRKKGEQSDEIAKSLREKMWRLPNYFRDLWKDFALKFNPLRNRISEFVLKNRWDLRLAKWSAITVGLGPRFGGYSEASITSTWRDERLISSSSMGGRKTRCSVERGLFFEYRTPIDPSLLGKQDTVKLPKSYIPNRYISHHVRKYFKALQQRDIDTHWEKVVTPCLANIPIR